MLFFLSSRDKEKVFQKVGCFFWWRWVQHETRLPLSLKSNRPPFFLGEMGRKKKKKKKRSELEWFTAYSSYYSAYFLPEKAGRESQKY